MKKISIIIFGLMTVLVFSQKQESNFKWDISFEKNKVRIDCSQGCGFETLLFKANRKVILNQNGMVDSNNKEEIENSEFLIVYHKRGKNIRLFGEKGVLWDELSFSHNKTSHNLVSSKGVEVKY